MSLISFGGICDFCGKDTKAGKGHFQSIGSLGKKEKAFFTGVNYKGKWLIRCFQCKGIRHTLIYSNYLRQKHDKI